MKVLISGITGFVGAHLAKAFLGAGKDVHGLIRPDSETVMLDNLGVSRSVRLHVCDNHINSVIQIMADTTPDIVCHLASLFLSTHTKDQVDDLISSNVLFGTRLLESMAEVGVCRFINTGTSWQHYNDTDYSPVNLYAATKQAFQDILQFYVEAKGLKVITLKLFDTFGPYDNRPKLMNLLRETCATGTTLDMSPGEQIIDMVHIDHVVSAYLKAAERLMQDKVNGHEIYGVSSERPQKLKDFVLFLEREWGCEIPVRWGARPYREREVMKPWSRFQKLK